MRRSIARFLAIPVASAGILAGVAFTAPAAFAQTDTGTVTVTVPLSYIQQLAEAGVVTFPAPASELSVDTTNQTATITFTVTGGDGDIRTFYGSLDLSGSLVIADDRGKEVTLGNLQLDLENGDIAGTPVGSTTAVPLLDLGGNVTYTPGATNQTYNASELTIDPAAATYLDHALCTSAFTAGQNVGSEAASWTLSD